MTILLAVLAVSVSSVFYFQPSLMFHPVEIPQDYVFQFATPFEEKFIPYGKKDRKIHALLFQPSKTDCRMLYFHGNGGSLNTWGLVGEELAVRLNCQVLIVDYPGFGKSSASVPSNEEDLNLSADAALSFFIQETATGSAAGKPLVLYGRSLGSGLATHLAANPEVKAIVLESPYTSIKAMAKLLVPIVPSFMVRYDIDNKKNLTSLAQSTNAQVPILIFHGTEDRVVPYSHSEELVQLMPSAKFITIEGGNHNNLPIYPQYWAELIRFMNGTVGMSRAGASAANQ